MTRRFRMSTAEKADKAWKRVVRLAHTKGVGVPPHEDQLDRRHLLNEEGLTDKQFNDLYRDIQTVRMALGQLPPLPKKED